MVKYPKIVWQKINWELVRRWFYFKYQKIKFGFSNKELWNLNYYISVFILPRLKAFKTKSSGYPGCLNSREEWNKILDDMIFAFEYQISDNFEYNDKLRKIAEKRYKRGMKYFTQYFGALWY